MAKAHSSNTDRVQVGEIHQQVEIVTEGSHQQFLHLQDPERKIFPEVHHFDVSQQHQQFHGQEIISLAELEHGIQQELVISDQFQQPHLQEQQQIWIISIE